MDNKGGVWKWIGAALVVVVVGVGLGFFLTDSRNPAQPQSSVVVDNAPADTSAAPDANTAATAPAPSAPSGEYTAKNAPNIEIDEQAPSVAPKPVSKPKPVAPPTPAPAALPTTATPVVSSPDDTTTPAQPSDSASQTGTPADAPLTTPAPDSTPTPPSTPAPPQNPAPPQDPAPSASDNSGATNTDNPDAQTDTGTLFHVIVGTTFASEVNARTFAASLRHRGFMAITASVQSDDGTVFKVQVGAYHNRVAAEQAATQLQQSGYPAYIATDR